MGWVTTKNLNHTRVKHESGYFCNYYNGDGYSFRSNCHNNKDSLHTLLFLSEVADETHDDQPWPHAGLPANRWLYNFVVAWYYATH